MRLFIFYLLIVALMLSGCTATRPEHFRTSFLPPAPPKPLVSKSTPADQPLAEPPRIGLDLYAKENPTFLRPDFPPRPSQLELRLLQAEQRFQTGRRMYQDGDTEAARREFNAALDLILDRRTGATDADARIRTEQRLERLIAAIYQYDRAGLGAADEDQEPAYDKAPLDDILTLTFPIDPSLKNKVREELRATVSQLPLEQTDAVLSYINYFSSSRGRPTLEAGLRRAGRYRPMISRILDEEGLPQELIHLAQAESGFLPRAVSRKKATGMWQFVQFRGREYGLMQTPYTDDRLDPEKATRAAARHLRDLYDRYGDWYLAVAAYNCGPGTVDKAVSRTGYADIWELRDRRVLPRETSNYVPIILAMTIMSKNAKDYGIDHIVPDPPLEYDTIEMTHSTHLALMADLSGTPVSSLQELNPSLLKNVAPAGHSLRVPKGSASSLKAALAGIPAHGRLTWRAHRLESDETMATVAKRFRLPVNTLASINDSAQPGELILIPVSAPAPAKTAVKTRSRAAVRKHVRRPASKGVQVARK